MIQPDKIQAEARKKEKENLKFRTYLKNHADEDELDRQFLRLHKELFADYDCSKYRNCYKMYRVAFQQKILTGIRNIWELHRNSLLKFTWKK